MASELIDTQNGIAWILASIGILRGDAEPLPPAPVFRYFDPRYARIDAKDSRYRWQNYFSGSVRGYTGLDLTAQGRTTVPDVYNPSMDLLDYEVKVITGAMPSMELLIYNNSQNAIPPSLVSGNYYRTYTPFGISNTKDYDDRNYTYDPLFWYMSPSLSHYIINTNVLIEIVKIQRVDLTEGALPEYHPLPTDGNPILVNIDGYWNTTTEKTLEGNWVDEGNKWKFTSSAKFYIQPNQLNKMYLKTYFCDWWMLNQQRVFYMSAPSSSPIVKISITLSAEE